MAKAKATSFFCKECGYESPKWLGQCPGCRQWNTFVEELTAKKEPAAKRGLGASYGNGPGGAGEGGMSKIRPSYLSEISLDEQDRMQTGYEELDRVLGGGVVRGSLVLVG